MKKRRLKRKFKVFLTIYFVLFTSFLSVDTLAKYAGNSSGTGTISIAKWDVSLVGDDNNSINIIKGNTTQEYKLKVISKSDVGITYSIIFTNVPIGLQVKIDDNVYVSALNNEIKINNVGIIDANATNKTKEHTLTFNALLETSDSTNKEIDMDVIFTQVNS